MEPVPPPAALVPWPSPPLATQGVLAAPEGSGHGVGQAPQALCRPGVWLDGDSLSFVLPSPSCPLPGGRPLRQSPAGLAALGPLL